MTRAELAVPLRRFAPLTALLFVLLLAAVTLLRHVAGAGDEAEHRVALQRYQRIAADLPALEAAVAARRPDASPADNPNLAAARWQTRLGQLAAARGLQLVSAEPLLADGRQSIALELVGSGPGLLAFVYEIERGAPAMTIGRLEVAPAASGDGTVSEPPLRIRLQAQAAGGVQ